jgi:hypothetical protein
MAASHGTHIRGQSLNCKKLFQQCEVCPVLGELDWIQSGQGDFNLWCHGLSAVATGKSSLDFRVRHRPDIRKIICDLLDGLDESLKDCLKKGMWNPRIFVQKRFLFQFISCYRERNFANLSTRFFRQKRCFKRI